MPKALNCEHEFVSLEVESPVSVQGQTHHVLSKKRESCRSERAQQGIGSDGGGSTTGALELEKIKSAGAVRTHNKIYASMI